MSNIFTNSVSSIHTPNLSYLDTFINFNQNIIKFEQGFIFNESEILRKTADVTVNNGTFQFLTEKKLLSDIVTPSAINSNRETITTPLIFNIFSQEEDEYVHIVYNNNENVLNQIIKPLDTLEFNNSIYFELDFLSDVLVRIKHNSGKKDYYLEYRNNELKFVHYRDTISETAKNKFRFVLDDIGFLQLYIDIGDTTYIIGNINGSLKILPLANTDNVSNNQSVMRISNSFLGIEYNPNSSFVSYTPLKFNDLDINLDKSRFDIPVQYLLHTSAYLTDVQINMLELKNNFSDTGFAKRGTNMIAGKSGIPKVEFKDYTNLYTGNDQELGNENIILNYVFYDKDIKIVNGRDTFFRAPSSIYPFEKLNINDTTFIDNGSMPGNSPLIADKIFIKKKETELYNNGRYLYTWLSGGSSSERGLWVDRYYYPDAFKKQEMLADNEVFAPSFFDNVDITELGSATNRRIISNNAFFDKLSDVVIEPNDMMVYRRISEEDISSLTSLMRPSVTGFSDIFDTSNSNCDTAPYNSIFDGSTYSKIPKQVFNQDQFTIAFDMEVYPDKINTFQIMGNDVRGGVSVRTSAVQTPFVFTYNSNKLYCFNTEYINLYETEFDSNIKDVILGDILRDFVVVCVDNTVYRVAADGVKVKEYLIPEINGYINYTQDKNNIIFLLSNGNCISIKKDNFSIDSVNTEHINVNDTSKKSIVIHENTVYTVPGEKPRKTNSSSRFLFYIYDETKLLRYDFITQGIEEFLQTEDRITDFTFDKDDNVIVSYGSKITTVLKNRIVADSSEFSIEDAVVVGVDFVEFNINGEPGSYISGVIHSPQGIDFVKLETDGPEGGFVEDIFASQIDADNLDLSLNAPILKTFSQTNYNFLRNIATESDLTFNITLQNYLNTEDFRTIEIPVLTDDISNGLHSFAFRFDSIQGNITLFIDSVLYKNVTVQPGKYKIQTNLNDDFYIGTVGFVNGVDLATFLRQPGYFYTNNLRISNFTVFDRAIFDDEITVLHLLDKKINDIVLSLPAGQRNSVEEIKRYFRFGSMNSSNVIDINVQNLNIKDPSIRSSIENIIREEMKDSLPSTISLNNIVFTDFK